MKNAAVLAELFESLPSGSSMAPRTDALFGALLFGS
jgi:hypothetical protein